LLVNRKRLGSRGRNVYAQEIGHGFVEMDGRVGGRACQKDFLL